MWTIDGTLPGTTTPGQRGPESDGNERVLRITQSSSITGTSPSHCLVSYPGHSLREVLPLCRDAVGVFCSPCRLGSKPSHCSLELWGIWNTPLLPLLPGPLWPGQVAPYRVQSMGQREQTIKRDSVSTSRFLVLLLILLIKIIIIDNVFESGFS